MIRLPLVYFILPVLIISNPNVAWSNAGPVASSGTLSGEPVVRTSILIEKEDLLIDFRSLKSSLEVRVNATYHLSNPGSAEEIELAFAFGSEGTSQHEIQVNGGKIGGAVTADEDFPVSENWFPPRTTPALDDWETPLRFSMWGKVKPLLFKAEIPPGKSTLEVSYVESARVYYAQPALLRQFIYILAPARGWSDFKNLNLRVIPPEGWQIAASLPLNPHNDSLVGDFRELPADAIAFTLRPHVSSVYSWGSRHRIWILPAGWLLLMLMLWRRNQSLFLAANASCEGAESVLPKTQMIPKIIWFSLMMASLAGGVVFIMTFGLEVIFPMSDFDQMLKAKLGIGGGYVKGLLYIIAFVGSFICTFAVSLILSLAQHHRICHR